MTNTKTTMPAPKSPLALTELMGEALKEARERGYKDYDSAVALRVALNKAGYRLSRMNPREYEKQVERWDRLESEAAFRKAERGEK